MATRPAYFLFSLVLLLSAAAAQGGTVEVEGQGDPDLYVVKVHADWCGSCKALAPILDEVRQAVASEPVLFLKLDVTDDALTAQSRLLSAALDIEEIFKANNKTGLVLLVDPAGNTLLEVLTRKNSAAEMTAKIQGHLAAMEQAEE